MFTQAITNTDAANIPGALHGQILALLPFLPRSQFTGLKPTRLSLAALPTPLLHHPVRCINTADKRALTLVICKPLQTVENFKPHCFSGSGYSCLQAPKSLHGCRLASAARAKHLCSIVLERSSPALGSGTAAKEPTSCHSFALENTQAPSVFSAFLQ